MTTTTPTVPLNNNVKRPVIDIPDESQQLKTPEFNGMFIDIKKCLFSKGS